MKSRTQQDQLARDYESLYQSYVTLRKQVEHLSTVREIGLAIYSTLDLQETLTLIANVVQGALDVRRLTIYEVDQREGTATPAIAKYGNDLIGKDRLDDESVPLARTPFGAALAERRVILESGALGSVAYVPLMARNTAVGVLKLEDRRDGMPFGHDDAELFHLLGTQIAIAIGNAQLYAMAVTDGLTRLYVRRYFDLRMEEEFDQAGRYGRCFSLLLFDIDHFKKFNDTHGHQTGDEVLKQVANLIKSNTRRSDVCCRYGGEEMAVILPETRLEEASVLATKLCGAVRKHAFVGSNGQELHVTVSIGVAEYRSDYEGPAAIVAAADTALYQAKELGRNRVELAGV